MKAPFPWFGGKSLAAALVWDRFGNVPNYVEPFAGSLAVLLSRPHDPGLETVNDKDGFISNVWRSIASRPEEVARWADWQVNEADLTARHAWLVEQRKDLTDRLMGDPDFCDPKIAGWWLWGISCWIAGGWCSGNGPWARVDGKLVRLRTKGRGVNRQRVHLGDKGRGVVDMMQGISSRLDRVRVCCGDWSRVCGPTPTFKNGLTGMFLDPPYSNAERCDGCYSEDDGSVAAECRDWAIANGENPELRIALCGYDTEHHMPDSWERVSWEAHGGYGARGGRKKRNSRRETIWFSPHCLKPSKQQVEMFS